MADNLSGSNLLANVSIDSEMNGIFSSGSIDLGDLEPTPRTDHTDQTYTKPKPAETYGEYNKSLDTRGVPEIRGKVP